MKTKTKRLILSAALLAASGFALAETLVESVRQNDLAPYDNSVEWNGFWSTTGRVYAVVSEASTELASGDAVQSAALADFDSRTRTTDDSGVVRITTTQPGFSLLVR